MKLKLLIALVTLVPSLVLAQTHLQPSGSATVGSTGQSAGMPSVPTPQTVQNTIKAVETLSSTSSMPPSNPVTPTSSTCSFGKSEGSTMKSSEKSAGKGTDNVCHYTSTGLLQCCDG
ncbi:MAG: hypothetical protein WCP66_10425 [Methylococcales bacterium]